jgi:hypothetical protein
MAKLASKKAVAPTPTMPTMPSTKKERKTRLSPAVQAAKDALAAARAGAKDGARRAKLEKLMARAKKLNDLLDAIELKIAEVEKQ